MVDRLKQAYAGKVDFRVYTDSPSGSEGDELARSFGIQYVPTFIFINSDGSTAGIKVGAPSEADLRAGIDALK